MGQLLARMGSPHRKFKLVHVAGTNGKGSTVAYVASVLRQAKIRTGTFTSPHLLLYNDCVGIAGKAYPRNDFDKVHSYVEAKNRELGLNCTQFEVLTATAFRIFELEKVDFAVVEAGLGGKLDATNVLPVFNGEGGVVASAITKVGMDHELFLGTKLPEIAGQKAGIIKGAPCVVDGSNAPEVLAVVEAAANDSQSPLFIVSESPMAHLLPLNGAYQAQNLAVALKVLEVLKQYVGLSAGHIEAGIKLTQWPGRLQTVTDPETGVTVLLDGAHNESAAQELGNFLKDEPHIFVVAMTRGKDVKSLLKHICSKEDLLIPATFTQPEGMPWVECYSPFEIAELADFKTTLLEDTSPRGIFSHLAALGDSRRIVCCGSLYFCADLLRHVMQSDGLGRS